ncbi:putative GNAT superfamily acetyltransferase [Caldalkalibacillus uzonensis]|uniref:GNAT superfamily acetyltransferase n=1 Tax=Caldalkalibacillus uzonensis TaxID=353224 RepID=A0ABU0CQY2_9BACI|nr:GNAT family N-acetyltransferase [Caldalkalibacillus uzonensis]MDQ0338833.1 putative GNAT superfamily acetyltransferase [Caldalkalibacillus uzonensis]
MAEPIIIKPLTTIEELEQVQELERDVWQMDPVPVHQTLTAVKNGGLVLGAFDGDKLVGFNYGFAGFKDDEVYLCSHMMGIAHAYRRQGIGELLKQKQKEMALQQGYSLIKWTYDPLESLNAYLNLSKLRAIGAEYVENCYGEMNDALNKGLPSDRFQVHWHIASEYVNGETVWIDQLPLRDDHVLVQYQLRSDQLPQLSDHISLEKMTTTASDYDGQAKLDHHSDKQGFWLPIPDNFQTLKKQDHALALDWRLKTRKIITHMLALGYVAVRLLKTDQGVHYYLFVPQHRLAL